MTSGTEPFRQPELVLRSLIDSPQAMVIFALDRQYRYLAYNQNHARTMQQIWGAQVGVGIDMLSLIGRDDDRLKARANFDRALAGESFTLIEEYGDTRMDRRFYEDIYSPVRDAFREIDGGDIPLGLVSGVAYEEYRVDEIEPGSIIVIGTDGIWEAPKAHGDPPHKELFGKERLCEVIRAHAHDTAEGIGAAINRALAEFCGKDSYPDDVTFVVMKMWVVAREPRTIAPL